MSSYRADHFVEYEKSWEYFQKMLHPRSPYAMMRIEAAELMGKTWLLRHMELHCQAQGTPVVRLNFDDPLDEIADMVDLLETLAGRFNRETAFAPFRAEIEQYRVTQQQRPLAAIQRLADKIIGYFVNDEDLNRLARYFNLNPADLKGDILSERAYSLVLYFYSRSLLGQLIEKIKEERSTVNVNWEQYQQEIEAAAPAVSTLSSALAGGSDTYSPAQKAINEAFFAGVRQLIADRGKVVVLLDAYENATLETKQWCALQLLPRIASEFKTNIVLVVVGTKELDGLYRPEIESLILEHPDTERQPAPLAPFELPHVKMYMEDIHKLQEEPPKLTWESMTYALDGVPGAIARKAEKIKREKLKRDGINDPFYGTGI